MTIRVGILSAGAWSRQTHLPALRRRDDVDIVSISSREERVARELAGAFSVPHHTTDWRDVLDQDLDAVIVSSPPVAHEEQVTAALSSGCHVLVEKPFALTSTSARAMTRASKRSGRSLLVGLGWNATPVFGKIRQAVADGVIGEFECVSIQLAVNIRDLLLDPARTTYANPADSGGGAAAVSMSHQLALLLFLTAQDVVDLDAHTYPPATALDLHDCVSARLSGGAAVSLTCLSGHRRGKGPSWRATLVGTGGEIAVDTDRRLLRTVDDAGTEWSDPDPAIHEYAAMAPVDALVDVAAGAPLPAGLDADLSARVVELTELLYATSGATDERD